MAEPVAYKVLTTPEWDSWRRDGVFAGSAADRADGFIHLSLAGQLAGTLDRHYAGQAGLVLVAVDLTSLGSVLRWEAARGGALFPHVYGTLALDAVLGTRPVERTEGGGVVLPAA